MNPINNTLDFYTTEQVYPGEPRMWAIYPFPGNYTDSVRVNQLPQYNEEHKLVYGSPVIEFGPFRLQDSAELRQVRTALDQAELKAMEWAYMTGEPAHE